MSRLLTVEIHDVSPATSARVRELARAIATLGLTRPTLLVVPSHVDRSGQRWDLRQDPRLLVWLHHRLADGAELVQHGLTHRAPAPPPAGWRHLSDRAMHRWFSRGEAEFAHLDGDEAARRLRRGRTILAECGLHADGFIAPAWQQSPTALAEVERAGFAFTAFLNHVQPLVGDRSPLRTPALTFAAPNRLIDRGKRAVMLGLEHLARRAPLLRVALHPVDAEGQHPPLPHILRRLEALLRRRRPTTYASWLATRCDELAAAA